MLFDWIYHRVTDEAPHDLNEFLLALDPGERDRCIFLDGITKSLGASNIRNCHLVASTAMIKFMQSRASHAVIPSFHSQAVAIAAYRMGFDRAAATIVGPTNASRKVMRSFVDEHGLRAILGKGYYAFLDMGPWIDHGGSRRRRRTRGHSRREIRSRRRSGIVFLRVRFALDPILLRPASRDHNGRNPAPVGRAVIALTRVSHRAS